MRTIGLILITGMICMSSISHADDKNSKVLDRAYMNALDRRYKEAIDKASTLLDSLTLNKIEDISLAHQILTISYCETGNQEESLNHLKALKAFSPNQDFRVFNPSPTCLKLLSPEISTPTKVKTLRR